MNTIQFLCKDIFNKEPIYNKFQHDIFSKERARDRKSKLPEFVFVEPQQNQ